MMFTFCILINLLCLTRGEATPEADPRANPMASPGADPFRSPYTAGYPIPRQYYHSSIGQHRFNSPYSGMSPYTFLSNYNFYSPNMQQAIDNLNPQGVANRIWSSDSQRYHQLHGFTDEVPGRSIYDYRNFLNNGVRNTRAMSSNFRIPNLSVLRTPLKTKTSQINALPDLMGQASVPLPVITIPPRASALSTVNEGVPLPTSDFSKMLSDVFSKRTAIDDDLMSDNSPVITSDDLQPSQPRNVKGFPHIIIIPPDIAFGNQVPVLSNPQPIEPTLRLDEMSTELSMPQHLLSNSGLNVIPAKLDTHPNLLSTSGLNGLSASLSTPQNSLMAPGGNSLQSIQSLAARSKFPTVINYLPININSNPQPRMQERNKLSFLDKPEEDLGEIDTISNNNILSSILEIISQQKVQRRNEDNFSMNKDMEFSGNSNNDIIDNNLLASILNKMLQQHNPRRNSEDFNLNRNNIPLSSSPSQQIEPLSSSSEPIKSRQGVPIFSSHQAIRNRQGIPLSLSSSQQGVPIPSFRNLINNQQGIPLSLSSSQQGVPLSSINQQGIPLPSISNSIESQQGVPLPSISEVIEIQQGLPLSSVSQQIVPLSSVSMPIVSQQGMPLSPSTDQERSLSSSSEPKQSQMMLSPPKQSQMISSPPMHSQMMSSPKGKYSKQKITPSSSGENIQSRKGMPLPSVSSSSQNQQGMSLPFLEQGMLPPSEIMLPPPKPLNNNEPMQSQRISSLEEKISELTEIIKGLKVQSTSPPRRKLYLIKV